MMLMQCRVQWILFVVAVVAIVVVADGHRRSSIVYHNEQWLWLLFRCLKDGDGLCLRDFDVMCYGGSVDNGGGTTAVLVEDVHFIVIVDG